MRAGRAYEIPEVAMGKLVFSQALQDRIQKIEAEAGGETPYWVHDAADKSCVTDYDTPAFNIFSNGFKLALEADGQDVLHADGEDGTTYFFIGPEEGALKRLEEVEASSSEEG